MFLRGGEEGLQAFYYSHLTAFSSQQLLRNIISLFYITWVSILHQNSAKHLSAEAYIFVQYLRS